MLGVTISEGAIANIFKRAREPMRAAADAIAAEVRNGKVVALDETSARVIGDNWWQWTWAMVTAVSHLMSIAVAPWC
jgi:transposase